MKFLIIFILVLSISDYATGQIKGISRPDGLDAAQKDTTTLDTLEKLIFVGKYTRDGILLKWAPTNYEWWERFNQTGYTLERFWLDTMGNGSATYELLSVPKIKPWPMKQFETYLSKPGYDDYVAIVGQTIYGKTNKSDYQSWSDQIDDKQNRYMYTLLSSEFSREAAKAAGLYFEDINVSPGKKYQYRLIADGVKMNQKDTVYLYLDTYEMDTIPQPFISTSKVEDGYLILGWKRKLHSRYFSGYFIERSSDGKNFKRMNKKPYVNPETDNLTLGSELITWKDTSAINYVNYQYRIIGITSYAELSEPSNPITLKTTDKTPPVQPINIMTKHLGDRRVEITWEFEGKETDLAGFMIGRSKNSETGFENISGDKPLNKLSRSFIDENCIHTSTNFYIVAAVDTSGNASASLVSYAPILDTIPPVKPVGLTGIIDTTGLVTLSWTPGRESDIKGYLVHTTNASNHVFTCITGKAVPGTGWKDTITLKTLTKEIFYKIQAVDLMGNISEYSDVVRLLKPDIVPPVKPVINDFKVEVGKVTLKWQPSTSKDVKNHILKRRLSTDTEWTDILVSQDIATTSYTDENVEQSKEYFYSLVAVDSTGNTSDYATIIPVKTLKDLRNPINNLTAQIDTTGRIISVSWNDQQKEQYKEIIIYKSVNKGPVLSQRRVAVRKGEKNTYIDKDFNPDETYEYTTKVVFEKGMTSGFSPLISAILLRDK